MKILKIKKTNPCRNCLILACCQTRCPTWEGYAFFKDKILAILVGIPFALICLFVAYMCYIHDHIVIYIMPHITSTILFGITLRLTKEVDGQDFSNIVSSSEFVFILLIIIIIGPWLFLMYCFQLLWNKINGPQPKIFWKGKTNVRISR